MPRLNLIQSTNYTQESRNPPRSGKEESAMGDIPYAVAVVLGFIFAFGISLLALIAFGGYSLP